jgi:hypothetical protein
MQANIRQHRIRRYRRVVSWVVVVLISSHLAAAISVDQFADEIRDPEYAQLESMLRARAAENPQAPLALFIGSSRVAHGFDAIQAAGSHDVVVFNFGIPGSGPYFQTVTMQRLREAGIRPDILFVEVLHTFYNAAGPRSLDHGLLDGARLSGREAIGLLSYGTRSHSGPIKRWTKARVLPLCRHQAEMRDRLGLGVYPLDGYSASPLHPIDSHGYRPRAVPVEDRAKHTEIAHENYDPFCAAFQLDPAPWKQLTDTIRLAQADGTLVVCVLMPEGSEFRGLYTLDGERERMKMLERLRDEAGVDVVDARAWLNDAAFFDQHHLLPDGANLFAERFRVDVLESSLRRLDRRIAER